MCTIGPNHAPLKNFVAVAAQAAVDRQNGTKPTADAVARNRAMMGLPAVQNGKTVLGV